MAIKNKYTAVARYKGKEGHPIFSKGVFYCLTTGKKGYGIRGVKEDFKPIYNEDLKLPISEDADIHKEFDLFCEDLNPRILPDVEKESEWKEILKELNSQGKHLYKDEIEKIVKKMGYY